MAVKRTETKRPKWIGILMIIGVIIIGISAFLCFVIDDYTGVDLTEDKKITIESGDTTGVIAKKLKEAGAVKFPLLFRLQAEFSHMDSGLQPGSATITNDMSYSDIISLLSESGRESTKITIPEGYEVRQIMQLLVDHGLCTEEEFYTELDPNKFDYRFIPYIGQRDLMLEGYLFPATYEIPNGASARAIIDMMLKKFDEEFTDEDYQRAAEIGMTCDQVVTMASIIERETASDTERKKVAGVFYNRRNTGMKLQSCATVQYILKQRKPILSLADIAIQSPYNTYLYVDLPIGPIANPGKECIEAALYPEATDAYYFVAGTDGKHIFSKTYEEHLAAVKQVESAVSVENEAAVENQDDKIKLGQVTPSPIPNGGVIN